MSAFARYHQGYNAAVAWLLISLLSLVRDGELLRLCHQPLRKSYNRKLGIKLLRSPPPRFQQTETGDKSGRELFMHAFTVTALNPKSITFFIAFVPQFIDPAIGLTLQFSVLVSSFVILAALNTLAYALLADRLRSRIKRPSVMKWLNRIGGSALIAMGIISTTLKRS